MRTARLISIVKSMLERANTMHEIARLTSLVISLQNEHIEALEKQLSKQILNNLKETRRLKELENEHRKAG